MLAQKVEDLQAYRSEFFGDLRKALAGEPNIKIVGDRYVFESDVLFPVDQATLTAQGQQNIADVAKAINAIAGKIPATINWVLSVDGYADQQKITGGPYRSNFDLSAARALAVLHLLIADGVPENRLVAAGFGAEHP
ncbi:MAG TPA: OmpA family protein, partial [Acetobacteraceae bacterium]|nr:OmpA family protein [Acetobacteraceae bacterium]